MSTIHRIFFLLLALLLLCACAPAKHTTMQEHHTVSDTLHVTMVDTTHVVHVRDSLLVHYSTLTRERIVTQYDTATGHKLSEVLERDIQGTLDAIFGRLSDSLAYYRNIAMEATRRDTLAHHEEVKPAEGTLKGGLTALFDLFIYAITIIGFTVVVSKFMDYYIKKKTSKG